LKGPEQPGARNGSHEQIQNDSLCRAHINPRQL
jgi:hypothetical protein